MLRPLAAALLSAATAAPLLAQAKIPDGTRTTRDLAYGTHERQRLDLLVPPGEGPFPVVVWVHGGAWLAGSKDGPHPALKLVEKGYAVAAVNYRLSQHAVFPAQIQDCQTAIRYLRANAGKHRLDPDHIGAWGASAGGHLVALLGTAADVPAFTGGGPGTSSRVQAVCDFFGPTDFAKMGAQSKKKGPIDHDSPDAPEAKLIGGPVPANKEKAQAANPVRYATPDDAPFLIFHGDLDTVVPPGQSELLHDALKAVGVESALVVVPNVGHDNRVGAGDNFDRIVAFFDRHLKKK